MAKDLEFETKFAVTPRGKTKWCKWNQPDTYGKFSVNVYFTDEDTEALNKTLTSMRDEAVKVATGSGKKVNGVADILREDSDGNMFFNFKVDASKIESGKVTIVDKFGKEDKDFNKLIGNDSIVKVKYMARGYHMPSTKQVGVSLRLMAIQVIELNEYSGSGGSDFSDESSNEEF